MLDVLASFVACHPGKRFVVGYSGGRDSHVLLHALSQLTPCVAFHINHQIHPNALAWQEHCEQEAHRLGCTFFTQTVNIPLHNPLGLEAMARTLRYQVLGDFLESNDILVTAHHSADQTETVLLALLRGSGPEGLKGIESEVSFKKGRLARPLLEISPVDIADYAKAHQLTWITDTSNFDSRYTRNALRLKTIPTLLGIEPGLLECVGRTARHCQESSELLMTLVHERHASRFQKHRLALEGLSTFSLPEQKVVLRKFIKEATGIYPPGVRLEELARQLNQAHSQTATQLNLPQGTFKRYKDYLYYIPLAQASLTLPASFEQEWDLQDTLVLPNGERLCASTLGLLGTIDAPLKVKARQGNPACHIGRRRTSLKNLYQALCVPPWERDNYPLLFKDDIVIGIPGLIMSSL